MGNTSGVRGQGMDQGCIPNIALQVHTYYLSALEVEEGGSLNLKAVWYTHLVSGKGMLHREALFGRNE